MKSHPIIQKTGMAVLTILMMSCFAQLVTAQGNLVVNGSFDTDTSGWILTDGATYAELGGNPPGCISLFPSNGIPTASQKISSLNPGQLYVISGDYYGGAGVKATTEDFGVAVDGVFLFEMNPPTSGLWYNFSFDYTATSTSALLSLSAPLNGTLYPFNIDNIAMYAVPEPNSLCLMGVGGIMSALFFRHRRKARRE
jgi:hypothetical protein